MVRRHTSQATNVATSSTPLAGEPRASSLVLARWRVVLNVSPRRALWQNAPDDQLLFLRLLLAFLLVFFLLLQLLLINDVSQRAPSCLHARVFAWFKKHRGSSFTSRQVACANVGVPASQPFHLVRARCHGSFVVVVVVNDVSPASSCLHARVFAWFKKHRGSSFTSRQVACANVGVPPSLPFRVRHTFARPSCGPNFFCRPLSIRILFRIREVSLPAQPSRSRRCISAMCLLLLVLFPFVFFHHSDRLITGSTTVTMTNIVLLITSPQGISRGSRERARTLRPTTTLLTTIMSY